MKNRRILTLSIILITILSISIVLINSKKISNTSDLPEENFVNLKLSVSINMEDQCNDIKDTSDPNYMLDRLYCSSGPILLMSATASGVVFKSIDEKSYILTADHFCNGEANSEGLDLLGDSLDKEISVIDYLGNETTSRLVYSDKNSDLCILESSVPIPSEIKISNSYPSYGEEIYSISAPHGIHYKNVYLHFSGKFSGCNSRGTCFYTIPAAPGSSGSLVFNSHNRIIGMIQMTAVGFNSLSMGVGIESINKFLKEASEHTGINFI